MKTRIKLMMAFVFIVSLMSYPLCISAGEKKTSDDKVQYLEDVVVTSTQTENTLLEAPSNISVINAADLKAMDAKNIAEALKKVPGVYYTNASGLEPKISLRGTHIGMSSGAMVLLNGIPMSMGEFGYTDFESIPVENIERIEVVKGPMSALYGGDSARGVINIITKRGEKTISGKISAIGGSYNDQRYSALLYGVKDKFDYNLNVKKLERDGYRDDTSLDNYYINGELGYWLSEETRIGVYLNVTDKDRNLAKKLTKEQRDKDPKQAPDYSDTENTDIITGFNFETKKDLFDFKTTLYYKNRDKTYENYLKATSTPYKKDMDEDMYGVRTIFTYKQPVVGKNNRISVGFDYDYDKIDLKTVKAESKTPGAPYTKPDPKKTGDFSREELGIFLQDEFSLLDNLTLTAGLRYDYFEFDNNADYDFSDGGKHEYDSTPNYDKWNPRASINYRPMDDLSVYGSYSRSYRAPNIYDYYASGSYSAKNAYTLKPETFTQYETGIRYIFSEWISLDTSVFRIEIEDMLDSAYDDEGKYMGKQNIGEVTIKGFELALFGSPAEWFSYKIAYTYTDARYADDILAKPDKTSTVNINGNRLTKVPYNRLNIDVDTRLYKYKDYELLWHVNLMAQDRYPMDKTNTGYYSGYTLVNTKLRLEHKSLEAFIAVDNVFDKDYDGYAYRSYGNDYYYPAAGTTFAGGLTYKF